MDGILLSLFTVATTLVASFVTNGVVSILAWAIKTGGSLWALFFFMKRWARNTGAMSAFGYGFKVCLCSAVICAAWTFIQMEFITPDKAAQTIEAVNTAIANQPGADTEEVQDMLLKIEDNFAQFNGIAILIWCVLCGLVFSAIFGNSAAAANVFAKGDSENKEEEEEL